MSPRGSRSYANVTATLALITALGGTAYAAVTVTGAEVKDNSLTGRDVRNNSLRSVDIRANAIETDEIADGTIVADDLSASLLPSTGATGAKGEAGATGAKGEAGATGQTGAKGPGGADGGAGSAGSGRSSIVARATFTGALSPTASNTLTPVPLTGGTWTQTADELDTYFADAVLTVPANCQGNFGSGSGIVFIYVTNASGTPELIGTVGAGNQGGQGDVQQTIRASFPADLGTAADRTFSAALRDECNTGSHVILHSLRIVAVGTT